MMISTRWMVTLLVTALGAACGGKESTFDPPDPPDPPGGGPVVASVEVTGLPPALYVGVSAQLTATVRDAEGKVLQGRPVTWTSSDPSVATVSGSGLVKAMSVGQATITATAGGKSGATSTSVVLVPVASILLVSPSSTLGAGAALQLSATPLDSAGQPLVGRALTWTSSDPARATVDQSGRVTGVQVGRVRITASAEGKSASTELDVINLIIPALDGGYAHTCGLSAGGVAYCWGANGAGQLGNGNTVNSPVPVVVNGGLRFTSLHPGKDFTCGLLADGSAHCWGSNAEGQLGTGGSASSLTPVAVATTVRFTALSAAYAHLCGLTAAGEVFCWGDNRHGQIGAGIGDDFVRTPTKVATQLHFVTVSARGYHSCAISDAGATYCWGANPFGQLGDGTTTDRATPVAVQGAPALVKLSAGGDHTCGLTAEGAAWCWGRNVNGELGDGTGVDRLTPVAVSGGLTFTMLSARGGHTCAVMASGLAYCWGRNANGELGTGDQTNRLEPALVAGGITFRVVSSGALFSCGLATTDTAYCWGSNGFGELGDGTMQPSAVPVRVAGQ